MHPPVAKPSRVSDFDVFWVCFFKISDMKRMLMSREKFFSKLQLNKNSDSSNNQSEDVKT